MNEFGSAPPTSRPWFVPGCLVLLLLFGGCWLLLPRVQTVRSEHLASCTSHLKQFGIALQTYHDQFKTFPPAFIADKYGVPMHSWRVLILPYLEDPELVKLYDQYRFDEPWNGPHNRTLLDKAPAVFRCPSDDANESETSYLAVIGPQTTWPGTGATALRQISDGTSRTIAVVECSDSGINWLEPRDVTFDDAANGINQLQNRPAIRSKHPGGANILFSDGSVHFLGDDIPAKTLHALLTSNGDENVELPE